MPANPPIPPDSDDYELAPEAPNSSRPAGSPKPAPTLAYHTAPKKSAESDDTETLKNLRIPISLLAAGVAVKVVAACFGGGNVGAEAASVGLDLILGTAVTLAGVLLAARLRSIQLGEFRYTILKLAAICIFPSAVLTLCMPVLRFIPLLGPLLGLGGEFILYFALLGVLFDLEESDTWYFVFIIFLVNLGVYFLLQYVISR